VPALKQTLSANELEELHLRFYEHRDPDVRSVLVERYQGLARRLASRSTKRPEDRDDLVQVALLGLVKALDRFEPQRGISFTTFAWATLEGELKRYHRDRDWSVRVPRRLQERYLRTSAAVEELTHELGRAPTLVEIADRTGDQVDEVTEALEVRRAHRPASIDAPTGEDGAGMQLGAHQSEMGRVEDRGLLNYLLDRLPAREREIVKLRFVDELTQSEIAARVGLSQMHVSRLLAQSLAQMRGWATAS